MTTFGPYDRRRMSNHGAVPESSSPRRQARLNRLAEELDEIGPNLRDTVPSFELLLEELDLALRPRVHERRFASTGVIIDPAAEPGEWSASTGLDVKRTPIEEGSLPGIRRFADGLSSWLVRRDDGPDEWLIFDRPAASERDLLVLSRAFDAIVVQRHPSGWVRMVGPFGVLRTHGLEWQYERPIGSWIDESSTCEVTAVPEVVQALLTFGVHDLGAQHIGALLIYRPDDLEGPQVEERLPTPPELNIRIPFHLGPLQHALSQIDGAAVFDRDGTLRQLGVRLVPSSGAEATVDALGGMRHTSGRRYSYDDPTAIVVVVSEDGPVTVLKGGAVVGRSALG